MSSEKSSTERVREFGLYELQPTLPGLLAETVRFFQQHRIEKPLAFAPVEGSRGWMAEIDLTWADICRILEEFPIAASWRLETLDGIETLVVEIELRSGRLRAMISKEHIDARMTGNGLLMHLDQGRVVRSGSGSRRVNVQTTTGLKS
jgi:hypothetical protein